MKPFDIEAAKRGEPVVYKRGDGVYLPARIICTDRNSSYPVVALVTGNTGHDEIATFTEDGRVMDNGSDPSLFMASKKCEGWINIYGTEENDARWARDVYASEDEAKNSAIKPHVTTIRIEWEE